MKKIHQHGIVLDTGGDMDQSWKYVKWRGQAQKATFYLISLYEIYRVGELIEMENRLAVAWAQE